MKDKMPENSIYFMGHVKGIRIFERAGLSDPHISLEIGNVDRDGVWVANNTWFSSFWLDELIQKLQEAKAFIETQDPDFDAQGIQWGWKFKPGALQAEIAIRAAIKEEE